MGRATEMRMCAHAEAYCSHYALQCGACTPGFITSTHAAIKKCHLAGQKPSIEALQQGLDGNLCRCTGYRPILDACRVQSSSFPTARDPGDFNPCVGAAWPKKLVWQ